MKKKRERGLVCLFCGKGFGYAGKKPDEATLKAAYDHEAECPENPYKARIAELEAALNKRPDAVKVARTLSDFVNCMGNKVEDVVVALDNEHRTLQQGITKFAVAWLEECAKKHDSHNFDMRNQASCELGKVFVGRIEPRERAMPFI